MKHVTLLTLLLVTSSFTSHSVMAKEYTVENTYNKLIKHYPDMRIPNKDTTLNITVTNDITYKTIDQQTLKLNVFAPKNNNTTHPLIVLVHGGGWSTGTPKLFTALARKLAANGFVVATPSYRLSAVAPYPASIFDINDAVAWLKKHHQDFAIDTQHIALGGGSAGGQIAELLAYSQAQLKGQQPHTPQTHVQALINIDGLSDFTSEEALPYENDPNRKVTSASAWLGGRFEDAPKQWHSASPINYISAESPPTLFINSSVPRFRAGRDAAINLLKQHNITTQVYQFSDAPHSFWLFDPWLDDTVKVMTEFLNAQFN